MAANLFSSIALICDSPWSCHGVVFLHDHVFERCYKDWKDLKFDIGNESEMLLHGMESDHIAFSISDQSDEAVLTNRHFLAN